MTILFKDEENKRFVQSGFPIEESCNFNNHDDFRYVLLIDFRGRRC